MRNIYKQVAKTRALEDLNKLNKIIGLDYQAVRLSEHWNNYFRLAQDFAEAYPEYNADYLERVPAKLFEIYGGDVLAANQIRNLRRTIQMLAARKKNGATLEILESDNGQKWLIAFKEKEGAPRYYFIDLGRTNIAGLICSGRGNLTAEQYQQLKTA